MARERFRLGRVEISLAALSALERNGQQVQPFLDRHRFGDSESRTAIEELECFEEALRLGDRILSVYYLRDGEQMWILTNQWRTITEVFLSSEVGWKDA